MHSPFKGQVLAEKLSKLNSSQQSIETLSHWCIFHRKKARQVVETWEKLFNSSPKEKRISFMYLANDILQNSRRNGSEFVNEFWKILPGALKTISGSEDDHVKSVATRLVYIWDDRRVFGSRGRVLKDEILGKEPVKDEMLGKEPVKDEILGKQPPYKVSISQSIKTLKKDANALRVKLALGCLPEKIMSAFQSVYDEDLNEDTVLNKCSSATQLMVTMEKNVDDVCAQGRVQESPLVDELQDQETSLKQYVEDLERFEATRTTLVSHLKESLEEQETKLQLIRTQLHMARVETERTSSLRQKLSVTLGRCTTSNSNFTSLPSETAAIIEANLSNPGSSTRTEKLPQPVTSFASTLTSAEEQNKKNAAKVAARLAAMTSSAEVLSSVFSSLVAQQAASRSNGLDSGTSNSSSPMYLSEKRPRLEKPMQNSGTGNTYMGQVSIQQMQSNYPHSSQSAPQGQPPFPSPVIQLPMAAPLQQFMQTNGGMSGVPPFGYGANILPPPPPPPTHVLMGLARPNPPMPPNPQQQPPPQQSAATTGFYSSPGHNFFGQPPATTVPRQ